MAMRKKRIIFLGEKPLGLKCLQFLHKLSGIEIVGVCTRTKGDFWWGKQAIIDYCEKQHITIIPRKEILEFDVDLMISVLYPFIVEPEYIKHARDGCFNLHEAPLPRWRGCNNYSHAILAGDHLYGTTLHEMKPELDAGNIVAKRIFEIPTWVTAKELYELTTHESYRLAEEWFPRILCGNYTTYTPSDGEESFINQRNSLANLKEIPLNTPLEQAMIITAALDFVPWEPAYVTFSGSKYYLFFEASMGREQVMFPIIRDIKGVTTLATIPWGTFDVGRICTMARTIVICKDNLYKQMFLLRP